MKYIYVAPESTTTHGRPIIAVSSASNSSLWHLTYRDKDAEPIQYTPIGELSLVELDGLYKELERGFYSATNAVYSLHYGVMMVKLKEARCSLHSAPSAEDNVL